MQDEDSISIATTILSETDFELNDHFDASSYNIPSSGPAQSLESILNESDTRSLISDWDASITGPPSSTHASPAHNSAGSSVCSASEVSSWSTASTFAGRGLPLRKPIRYDGHGPCLKLDKQLAISATLAKQIVNNNVGTASCMYAGGCIVVIGTLHGYVLIFNEEGGLLHKLGTSATCSSFGAVSSLCLNRDCSRILVGHANGQITMWDCNTGKLLRTIIDAHPPQMAVLHIKFTDDLTLAIFSDSGGSVYELSFKRIMGVRSYDSRCLFSGSRGEVCVVEPLLTSEMRASSQGRHIAKGHTQDIVVLAMCSLSKSGNHSTSYIRVCRGMRDSRTNRWHDVRHGPLNHMQPLHESNHRQRLQEPPPPPSPPVLASTAGQLLQGRHRRLRKVKNSVEGRVECSVKGSVKGTVKASVEGGIE